ncbi:MAG: response regulator [Gemmatimonadetes bacterium]|nr:response regulator [Gemmatimonadota bacterium]
MSRRAPRLLLLEDDWRVREALVAGLTSRGFEVRAGGNGAEGLGQLRREAVDGVITDLLMPDCDGVEFLLALRRESPAVPVVAISGGGVMPPGELLRVAHQLGAAQVLEKPFTLRMLMAALERVGVAGHAHP